MRTLDAAAAPPPEGETMTNAADVVRSFMKTMMA